MNLVMPTDSPIYAGSNNSKALTWQYECEGSIELMRPQYTHHQVFLSASTAE